MQNIEIYDNCSTILRQATRDNKESTCIVALQYIVSQANFLVLKPDVTAWIIFLVALLEWGNKLEGSPEVWHSNVLLYIDSISKLKIINGKLFLTADDSLLFVQGSGWHDVRSKALNDVMVLERSLDLNFCLFKNIKTKVLTVSDYIKIRLYFRLMNTSNN